MDDVIDVEVQALLCYRALVSRDRLLERCPWTGLEDALDPGWDGPRLRHAG